MTTERRGLQGLTALWLLGRHGLLKACCPAPPKLAYAGATYTDATVTLNGQPLLLESVSYTRRVR